MSYVQTSTGVLMPARFAAGPRRPEFNEIATTRDGRDITRGYVDPMQLQTPADSVLRARGHGDYQIYQEVLRDDQVMTCFQQRRLAVVGKEWTVDPGDGRRDSRRAADQLRETLMHVGWDRVTSLMMFAIYYGYGVAEALWVRDGVHIGMEAIKVRDRRRFGWDGAGRLRMKTVDNPLGEPLPERKFWAFCTGADHDDEPYGLGLAHWLYWPVFFKRAGVGFWMTFLERFGQPTAVGKHPGQATPQEISTLLNALEAINTDTGIAIPDGMVIELLEARRGGTGDYTSLYERMDSAIARVVLGQTASTQGTPGRLGNDELQGDVRLDLVKADADLICESFNRTIARWLCAYNYPDAAPPRVYRQVESAEDQEKRAARDHRIYQMGYRPTLGYITETYGGEWERSDAGATDTVPPSPEPAAFAAPPPTPAPPAQMLEPLRRTLEPVRADWIAQVRTLAEEVDSLEGLRDRLLTLFPRMTLDDYAQALAEGLAAAHLAGRDAVEASQ